MCPKSRGLWFHNHLILVLLGGVCGSLDCPLHCPCQRSHWVDSTCKLAGQLGGRVGWASCTDAGHLMSLLIIPFSHSQPEMHVHPFQQAYWDSGRTGVLASACTFCPVELGDMELVAVEWSTRIGPLWSSSQSYRDPRGSLLVQGIMEV